MWFILGVARGAVVNMSSDSMVTTSIYHCVIQIRILKHSFSKLAPGAHQKGVYKQLIECAKHYEVISE